MLGRGLAYPGAAILLMACSGGMSPTVPLAPPARAPILEGSVRAIGQGRIELSIQPGQSSSIDGLRLAIQAGIAAPPCAAFVFAFVWQVTQPYPAGTASVEFIGNRMGGTFTVGRPGPEGSGQIGCAGLDAINRGAMPVKIEVRYVIGEVRP